MTQIFGASLSLKATTLIRTAMPPPLPIQTHTHTHTHILVRHSSAKSIIVVLVFVVRAEERYSLINPNPEPRVRAKRINQKLICKLCLRGRKKGGVGGGWGERWKDEVTPKYKLCLGNPKKKYSCPKTIRMTSYKKETIDLGLQKIYNLFNKF